jgi:hypothetical protein
LAVLSGGQMAFWPWARDAPEISVASPRPPIRQGKHLKSLHIL